MGLCRPVEEIENSNDTPNHDHKRSVEVKDRGKAFRSGDQAYRRGGAGSYSQHARDLQMTCWSMEGGNRSHSGRRRDDCVEAKASGQRLWRRTVCRTLCWSYA